MLCKGAAGPGFAVFGHRAGEVCEASAAGVKIQPMTVLDRRPVRRGDRARAHGPARGFAGSDPHRAGEDIGTITGVRIGDAQRALGAVDFQPRGLAVPDIEADHHLPNHPIFEFEQAQAVGIDLDRHHLAVARAVLDHPLGKGPPGQTRRPRDRAQQKHQRGQVVWAQIEQRTAAVGVVEIWVGVVALDPVGGDEGRHAGRLADHAFIERAAQGLPPPAEEGIGCVSDQQALLRGQRQNVPSVFEIGDEWLLRIDVLTVFQRPQRNVGVGCRDGQVQNRINIRHAQDFVRIGHQWHTKGSGLGLALRSV